MVKQLAKLKWKLFLRSYKGNWGKIIGTIILVPYIGGLIAVAMFGLMFSAWSGTEIFPQVLMIMLALMLTANIITPLIAVNAESIIDTTQLALFPKTAKQLQTGLFTASLISWLAVLHIVISVAATVATEIYIFSPERPLGQVASPYAAAIIAPVAFILMFLTLQLLTLAIGELMQSLHLSRRSKEILGILMLLVVLGVAYGGSLAMTGIAELGDDNIENLFHAFLGISEYAQYLPWVASVSAVFIALTGNPLFSGIALLVAVAVVVGLWKLWGYAIQARLDEPLTSSNSAKSNSKPTHLLPKFVPATQTGAYLARSLIYWKRDNRYRMGLLVTVLVCLFLIAMGVIQNNPVMMVMVLFMVSISAGSNTNDFGLDGPANWVSMTAGANSEANLRGRIYATLIVVAPLAIIPAVAIGLIMKDWALAPITLLAVVGMMLSNSALAALSSVLLPFPMMEPGSTKNKAGFTANGMLNAMIVTLGVWIPQIPGWGLFLYGFLQSSNPLMWSGAAVITITGILVMVFIPKLTAKLLDERYPAIFAKVKDYITA